MLKVLKKPEMMSEGVRNDIESQHSLIVFPTKSNYGNSKKEISNPSPR